jgi:biotin carboxyl carrier protein
MTEPLIARVESVEAPQRGYLVRSPGVGILEAAPAVGAHLGPAACPLILRILHLPHRVLLPRGVEGFVAERFVDGRAPVEFNQPLLRLALSASPTAGEAAGARAEEAGAGARPELLAVTAPSEGIFYARAKPGAPPYAPVGSAVSTGAVLGLVEVMKCFNPITYGGPGLPATGVIAEVLVGDAAEVKFGQTLFLVKPG